MHIIGKVYDMNQDNWNKLIRELDDTQEKLRIATDALEEVSLLMSHPAPGLSDFGESEHWKRESWSRRSTAIEALDALKSQKEK